jgi:hypothetical protein
MRKLLLLLFIALAILASAASVSVAEMWTLSGDMSSMVPNPNGAWTYGVYLDDSLTPPYPPFYIWPEDRVWAGIDQLHYYGNDSDLNCGAIFHNPTDTPFQGGTQWLLPGDVCIFTGYLPSYCSAIRWTAPADMTVSVDAVFAGHDEVTADVHVLLDGDMLGSGDFTGTHLLDGVINGNIGCPSLGIAASGTSPSQTYTDTLILTAGQYIDFIVYAPDSNIDNDMTGLAVTITTVPEPTSIVLLTSALLGLAAVASRRRK